MLEFSRLTATLAGMFGGAGAAQAADAGPFDVAQILETAGLDPAALQGLSPDAALQLLQDYGIDPAALGGDADQILASFGIENPAAQFLTGLWSEASPEGHK
jgi:hypothetical protein